MGNFTIYKGEQAFRNDAVRLEAEVRQLRAENNRLRAACGEEVVAEIEAELVEERALNPQSGQIAGGVGSFVIGPAPGPRAPAQNPLISRARANKANAAPAGAPPQTAAQRKPGSPRLVQPNDLPTSTQEAVAEDSAASQRFQLMELKR